MLGNLKLKMDINVLNVLNINGLNVPEDDIKCESFTAVLIDSLLVYKNKYYQQEYLKYFAYKIAKKQMADYLGDNLFEDSIL